MQSACQLDNASDQELKEVKWEPMRWLPFPEKQPQVEGRYVISYVLWHGDRKIFVGDWKDGKWDPALRSWNITHWCDVGLPE